MNSVRGLSEPPELHQRLGSGSRQPLAVHSAAGPGGEGRLPERSVRDLRAQGPWTTWENESCKPWAAGASRDAMWRLPGTLETPAEMQPG